MSTNVTHHEGIIREAIKDRRPMELCYADGLARTVHPHALFRTAKNNVCVETYQVAGATTSRGTLPAWRPFNLEKIRGIELLDGRFEVEPDFDPAGHKYRNGLLASVHG